MNQLDIERAKNIAENGRVIVLMVFVCCLIWAGPLWSMLPVLALCISYYIDILNLRGWPLMAAHLLTVALIAACILNIFLQI